MSQLIHMRQRIKAIETIKKITHAMQLISMSLHGRLKHQEEALQLYKNSVGSLFNGVKVHAPGWTHPRLYPTSTQNPKTVIILVSSQKGLCGNFNTALFKLFEMNYPGLINVHIITVGKKAYDYCASKHGHRVLASYPVITTATYIAISKDICQLIMQAQPQCTQVLVLSNVIKNFFIQRPRMTQLIPFAPVGTSTMNPGDYVWEQDPMHILDSMVNQTIEACIAHLLFQSLLAEQAARFISMDNATRNANSLLEETKTLYNKVRQTKITKELTELTSSF